MRVLTIRRMADLVEEGKKFFSKRGAGLPDRGGVGDNHDVGWWGWGDRGGNRLEAAAHLVAFHGRLTHFCTNHETAACVFVGPGRSSDG